MADNESVNMEGVWLIYYAFPNEGVEGDMILDIEGDIPKEDVIGHIRSSIFNGFDATFKEQCGAPANMVIRGLTRIGDLK